jgi:hypothetical protein
MSSFSGQETKDSRAWEQRAVGEHHVLSLEALVWISEYVVVRLAMTMVPKIASSALNMRSAWARESPAFTHNLGARARILPIAYAPTKKNMPNTTVDLVSRKAP